MKKIDDRLIKKDIGYWQIKNKPSQEELERYYKEKYYQEAKGSYEIQYSKDELDYFNAKINQKYYLVKKYCPDGKNYLDIGCGEGFSLNFFRKKGWEIKGLDFSSFGIETQNPDCLDSLKTGDIFKLIDQELIHNNKYDVLWLQNVLEHVLEPEKLLSDLKSVMNKDGVLVITVPNDNSKLQLNALENKYIDKSFWVAPPDHINYFDNKSLLKFSESVGWNTLDLISDFPIDLYIFNKKSNYISYPETGKNAHKARIDIENLINTENLEDIINYWRASARIGLGRDLTVFLTDS